MLLFQTYCLYLTLPLVLLCCVIDIVRERVPDSAWGPLLDRLKAWALAQGQAKAQAWMQRRAWRRAHPRAKAPDRRPRWMKLGWPLP